MRIAINARFLNKPFTGIGQYTRALLQNLKIDRAKDKFFFITPQNFSTDVIARPPSCHCERSEAISLLNDFSTGLLRRSAPRNDTKSPPRSARNDTQKENIVILSEPYLGNISLNKYWWEYHTLPAWCRKNEIDILHHLYPVPIKKNHNLKQIITIHDTIPWTEKHYAVSLKSKIYQKMTEKSALLADKIIAVSNSTQQELIDFFSEYPLQNLSTIYQSADEIYGIPLDEDKKAEIRHKYGIKKAFFLYVGGYDPRKNTVQLVQTFQEKIAPRYEVDLVLAGDKALQHNLYKTFDLLQKASKTLTIDLKGSLILTGFMPDRDLAALYQSSLGFLSLSRKEGFNIPICEAVKSRVPILLSDTPVHREISAEKALFCDLEDLNDIAAKMETLITQPADQRQKIISNLQDICQKYSWQRTAEKTYQLYLSLCSSS